MHRRVAIGVLVQLSAACGAAGVSTPVARRAAIPIVHVAAKDSGGVAAPREGALQFQQLDAGGDHTCGLRRNGSVFCWGNSAEEVTGPNADVGRDIVQIAAGHSDTCLLRSDGSVTCWGGKLRESLTSTELVQIDVGRDHGCGLRRDGSISCWVGPDSKHGGYPYPTSKPRHGIEVDGPNADTSTGYIDVAVDWDTCALRSEGSVVCWGTPAPGATDFLQIVAGAHKFCGLRKDGTALCWGDGARSQARDPRSDAGPGFKQLSTGWGRTCGLRTDGSISCWGSIDPTFEGYATAPSAESGHDFVQVAVSEKKICALRSNGIVTCWNIYGGVRHYR